MAGEAGPTAPRIARGRDQLRSALWRQALLKRRAACATCCELTSPALFLCILVLGYYLSDPEAFPSAVYAMLNLDLAPLLELGIASTRVGLRRCDLRHVWALCEHIPPEAVGHIRVSRPHRSPFRACTAPPQLRP